MYELSRRIYRGTEDVGIVGNKDLDVHAKSSKFAGVPPAVAAEAPVEWLPTPCATRRWPSLIAT